MAYPATIENAKVRFDQTCANFKATTASNRVASEAGPVSANGIKSYMEYLRAEYAVMQEIAAIPGIGAAYPDIADDAGAVMSETLDTIQWIAANFPKNGGKLSYETVDLTTGVITVDTFSTAALAGLRTQMSALEATIT